MAAGQAVMCVHPRSGKAKLSTVAPRARIAATAPCVFAGNTTESVGKYTNRIGVVGAQS